MNTLETLQLNIRQLFNGCHLSKEELEFTKKQLACLLDDVNKRIVTNS